MNFYNHIFWAVFVAAAIVSIIIALGDLFFFGVIFCLFVILAGIAKLEQDKNNKEIIDSFDTIDDEMSTLSRNFEKSHLYTRDTRDQTDSRIQKFESKRIETEKQIEKMYRDVVKKIIQIENSLNKMNKETKKK